jgi:metallo-beta-lactamase family protein
LGSACVQIRYIENEHERIITFTGDLGSGRSYVIKPPEKIYETDFLISESTYGDRNLKNLSENDLADLINRVHKRQGTLIIPAFSVGRTQEILYIIKKLQKENKISVELPIYLDSPMATKASVIYTKFPEELKLSAKEPMANNFFHPVNFRVCETPDESMLLCMSDMPKIVMSASGMLQGGRVLHHLRSKLPDPKSAVLFTGYQGQGTKGLLLKGGLNKIRIHHKDVDVEAEIVTLDALSAHADSNELMNFYSNFKKAPRMTFLTHGEVNSLGALKYRITNELGWPCTVPEIDNEFNLD